MCGDALELPYRRLFRFVCFNMVEDLVVCDDLFSLIIAKGAKELDPGGIVLYLPVIIFNC
jgi:hypothetical protein